MLKTLPPPLRAAVDDLDEATRALDRIVGWLPVMGVPVGGGEWVTACVSDLEVARDRVLTAWRAGQTSSALASFEIRRSVDALLERLHAGLD